MCGIAGFLGFGNLRASDVSSIGSQMGSALHHRGPDDAGIWVDYSEQILFAHQRLSIMDLSSAGHQPMESPSGRYVLVFNGEIYNHNDLRLDLETISSNSTTKVNWNGHSDTETLLTAVEAWGLEETLKRSTGMFAVALWDRHARTLFLARDRLGEKPLYCGWQDGVFIFGSELKAIKAHPSFIGEVDRDSVSIQLRLSYIPSPYSIYKGIGKIPPGTILSLDSGAIARKYGPEKAKPYWEMSDVVERSKAAPFMGTDTEAIEALNCLLEQTIDQQMMSDVPLGAFLSGGIDSSVIVALMQSLSDRPVNTFTIGFNEECYNEAHHAKQVARHLGTEHTELYVSPEQALDVIPRLPLLYDEPFSDASQIPTFLVSQMTQQHVTVSLSGDAGDELFGGYNRYLLAHRFWGILSRLSQTTRRLGAGTLTALSPDQWNKILGPIQAVMPSKWQLANIGYKFHKGAEVLRSDSLNALYLGLVSNWDTPSSVVINGHQPVTQLDTPIVSPSAINEIERMMLLDTLTYLPDDILVKVDRAAMGVSLETRVPFLSHHVVEFAWRLPLSMKIRKGQGKWILRQVLYKHVPKELIDRPKKGFGVPIDSW